MENFFANQYGQVMAIDTDSDYVIIESRIHEDDCGYPGWGHPVIDADKNKYFPRYFHVQVLKCNPITQKICLILDSYDNRCLFMEERCVTIFWKLIVVISMSR